MVPSKNYEHNRLELGMLQMCDGSSLLLDETMLGAGTLQNTGVTNVKALKEMLQSGQVEFNYDFSQVPIQVNIRTLTLSAEKSMLS